MPSRKKSIRLTFQEVCDVHRWVKKFNLSKEIKNIPRDLTDGVLVAEILKQLYPKLVDLHNYTKCNATRNKLDNWQTLNRKVFSRLNIYLDDEMLTELAGGTNEMIEVLLFELMAKYTCDNQPSYHHHDGAEQEELQNHSKEYHP